MLKELLVRSEDLSEATFAPLTFGADLEDFIASQVRAQERILAAAQCNLRLREVRNYLDRVDEVLLKRMEAVAGAA